MAAKGARTRAMVVERAAHLFNQQGYHSCSISDVLRATGLEKGGLYNHFGSKDALAIEAFDYAVSLVEQRFRQAIDGRHSAVDKLLAIIDAFARLATDPPVPGGCPVLNTAIEAADTHPELYERARASMTAWQRLVGSIVKEGVRSRELRDDVDPRRVATVVTATLEGAVMLSRLFDDAVHMRRAVAHLREHLGSLEASVPRRDVTASSGGEGS